MKSLLLISLLSVSATFMLKGPDITFDNQVIEADTINMPVYHGEFTFENTGDQPLVISRVASAAGNVTTRWDKEPIMPGGISKIEFLMDTRGRQGKFNSTITVDANTEQKQYILTIKGYIQPKNEE